MRLLKRHTTSLSLIVQPSLTTTMRAFGQYFLFQGLTFAYTVEDLLKLQFESFFFFFNNVIGKFVFSTFQRHQIRVIWSCGHKIIQMGSWII